MFLLAQIILVIKTEEKTTDSILKKESTTAYAESSFQYYPHATSHTIVM
jgi:hypothetical protein